MFTKLRPKNVLLLKYQHMDQCKCLLYENFQLKLDTFRNSFDAIFWSKVLFCSENYNSECRKDECDEFTNRKNIQFPDTLDNENVTYKELQS